MEGIGIEGKSAFCAFDHGIRFDLNAPTRMQELGNDNHGRSRTDGAKHLAVHAANRFPVFRMCQIDARTDHVGQLRSCCDERSLNNLEHLAGLRCGIGIVGAHGSGAGDVNGIPYAHRAGEAYNGFERGTAADVLSHRL